MSRERKEMLRRRVTIIRFVTVVALYGALSGMYLWVWLDSDDAHALVPEGSTATWNVIRVGAAVLQVAAGFALGRWLGVAVLPGVALAIGAVLTSNEEPCAGWYCWADRDTMSITTLLLGTLVVLGVAVRKLVGRVRARGSGRRRTAGPRFSR